MIEFMDLTDEKDIEKYLADFLKELKAVDKKFDAGYVFRFDRFDHVLVLIGMVMLALRHPEIKPESYRIMSNFVRMVQESVKEFPIVNSIIEKGFHEEFDVTKQQMDKFYKSFNRGNN